MLCNNDIIYSAKEMMRFIARNISYEIQPNVKTSLEYKGQLGHVYKQKNGIAIVCITSGDYPSRAAHGVITKVLHEFNGTFKENYWKKCSDDELKFPALIKILQAYSQPKKDKIEEIQQSIDDAKSIVQTTIEKVLQNMDKLDELVAKSNDLSDTSRMFYKKSKKLNRCCVIL